MGRCTFLLSLFLGALASPCAAAEAAVPVRVGYLPATHDTLLFIAKDLELFDMKSIDVRLKPYENSVQILSDLKSGLLDIGIPGVATPASEIGGRAALTIIGGAATQSAALVGPKALADAADRVKGVTEKLKLLRGKRVGAVRGSTGLAVFRQGLVQAGFLDKDIDIREYAKPPEIVNGLLNGDLDAGLLWSPHMTLAEAKGQKIAIWMYEILPNHVCCRQVARDEFLAQYPDATAAYLAGILRAFKALEKAESQLALQERLRIAIRKYLPTLSDTQLDLEVFGANPRTTLNPDLDRTGVEKYLEAMKSAKLMQPDECDHVAKKTSDHFLKLAYLRLGCEERAAEACAKSPAEQCACLR